MAQKVCCGFLVRPALSVGWVTSPFFFEVEKVHDIEVNFHVHQPGGARRRQGGPARAVPRRSRPTAWKPVRVAIAAEQAKGPEILAPLYAAMGTRIHNQSYENFDPDFTTVIKESGSEGVGLPAEAKGGTPISTTRRCARATTRAWIHQRRIGTPTDSRRGRGVLRARVRKIRARVGGRDLGRLGDVFVPIRTFWELKRHCQKEPPTFRLT